MAEENRRLAAIVAADVADYSRLVGEDDTAAVSAVRAIRHDVLDPLLQRYQGRLANTAGDSFLLEFPNVRAAVGFCIEFQIEVAARSSRVAAQLKIKLRIGLTVGEVIAEGQDIHGDAVNIAARLQTIATPGSFCISGEAYDMIRSKLYDQFTDGGLQELKNINRPIRVWHWSSPATQPPAPAQDKSPSDAPSPPPRLPSKARPPATKLSALMTRHKAGLDQAAEENPFIVFLCGPTLSDLSKPSAKLRLDLKKALEAEKFEVVLGEDDGLEDGRVAVGVNAQDNELEFISTSCNAVILIADSVGAFCELGLFSWHFVHTGGKLKKTRGQTEFFLLLDEKFSDAKSYLKEGPTRAVNGFGTVLYVDFSSFDANPVLARMRDRRGVMIVDNKRGRPRKSVA